MNYIYDMKILIALLLSSLCASAQSTINWSAAPNQRDVRLATGAPITSGTAAIGFYDGDVWYQYGITDIREIFGEPARFAGVASSIDPVFTGKQIYLKLDAGFTGGLFTSSQDNWVFPDPYAVPPNNLTSINSSEVDTAVVGFFNEGHLILVPEPAPAMILSAACLMLLIALRRQRQ